MNMECVNRLAEEETLSRTSSTQMTNLEEEEKLQQGGGGCLRISVDETNSPRPASPCDSEISVGCEEEAQQQQQQQQPPQQTTTSTPPTSPMDMAGADNIYNDGGDADEDTEMEPQSPTTSRGGPSPALSSTSVHTESLSYLSEDEYFRPLKRLAMSGTSPTPSERLRFLQQQTNSFSPLQHSVLSPPTPRQISSPDTIRPINLLSPPPLILKKLTEEEEQDRIQRSLEEEKNNGLRSFSILDILSYKPPPSRRKSSVPVKIVRPWDNRGDSSSDDGSPVRQQMKSEPQSNNNNNKSNNKNDKGGALDALFKMTNQTLDNLNKDDKAG